MAGLYNINVGHIDDHGVIADNVLLPVWTGDDRAEALDKFVQGLEPDQVTVIPSKVVGQVVGYLCRSIKFISL